MNTRTRRAQGELRWNAADTKISQSQNSCSPSVTTMVVTDVPIIEQSARIAPASLREKYMPQPFHGRFRRFSQAVN
jgi:hypothetical protein